MFDPTPSHASEPGAVVGSVHGNGFSCPQGGPEQALQHATPVPLPAEVLAAATEILTGGLTLTESFLLAVQVLERTPNVRRVYAVSTTLRPDREEGWIQLGERAWLMESNPAGMSPTAPVGTDAGPYRASSLPWFSQQVRKWGVAGITDTRLLDGPAREDRTEIERTGAMAVLGSGMMCEGVMYGSLGVDRAVPGPWPEESLSTIRLLSAVLASRMSADYSRAALAGAIERGDQARDNQRHFFSALGHELRTPLSAIIGTAEILGEDAAEVSDSTSAAELDIESVLEFVAGAAKDSEVMLSAAEQLLAVVDSLLETGQELGGGGQAQPVQVAAAVSDVIHWLKAPALAAGVDVARAPDMKEWVSMTPSGLRQILTNLVGNAVAYNNRGGQVNIETSRSTDELGSARVRITVHDTGPGLTSAQQTEVFRPFVRFAGPHVPGTGLGLALSRSLAERHGGLMGVESVPGQGASFWVDLPGTAAPSP